MGQFKKRHGKDQLGTTNFQMVMLKIWLITYFSRKESIGHCIVPSL